MQNWNNNISETFIFLFKCWLKKTFRILIAQALWIKMTNVIMLMRQEYSYIWNNVLCRCLGIKCNYALYGQQEDWNNLNQLSTIKITLYSRLSAIGSKSTHGESLWNWKACQEPVHVKLLSHSVFIPVCVRGASGLLQNPDPGRKEHSMYRGGWPGCHGDRV